MAQQRTQVQRTRSRKRSASTMAPLQRKHGGNGGTAAAAATLQRIAAVLPAQPGK